MSCLLPSLIALVLPALSTPESPARFGTSLSVLGDRLAVGAPGAASDHGPNAGAVALWRRVADGWERERVLVGDGRPEARFGASVDLDHGFLAVGAFFADGPEVRTGAVHLFTADGSSALERLVPPDAKQFDGFGWSLDLEGDRLLVGAPFRDGAPGFQSGAAYVYRRVGTDWVLQDELVPTTLQAFDHFGWSVTWSGDRALVGAPDHDQLGPGSGAVFVFRFQGTGWEQEAALHATGMAPGGGLGVSLAASGSRVVAGAPWGDAVRTWRRTSGGWDHETDLFGAPMSRFGESVSLGRGVLLVGAPAGLGEARRFRRRSGTWLADGDWSGSDPVASFGSAVALDGDAALIGVPAGDGGAPDVPRGGRVHLAN